MTDLTADVLAALGADPYWLQQPQVERIALERYIRDNFLNLFSDVLTHRVSFFEVLEIKITWVRFLLSNGFPDYVYQELPPVELLHASARDITASNTAHAKAVYIKHLKHLLDQLESSVYSLESDLGLLLDLGLSAYAANQALHRSLTVEDLFRLSPGVIFNFNTPIID